MLRLPGSTEAVATLLDAVLAVGSELDLDVLLPRLVRSACYLVGARYGSLGILRQDASGVVESVTDGLNPDDLGLLGVNSSLEVPVMVRGQAFGMLSLADKVGGLDFTEDDQALVQALAGAAGMALSLIHI